MLGNGVGSWSVQLLAIVGVAVGGRDAHDLARAKPPGENMTSWFPAVSAVIGILAGGVFTYMTSRGQLRIQAEHDYDLALRDLRLPHYQELFHLTGAIPREWWPSSALTRRDVLALRERFHDWYSEIGRAACSFPRTSVRPIAHSRSSFRKQRGI
jgi:hypothetical protein